MNLKRAIELMKVERECVTRNDDVHCDRDCANCDLRGLLEKTDDIIDAYDTVIDRLEDYAAGGNARSNRGWLLFLLAYVPTAIFTVATCHFVDRGNWIGAGVFFALMLITLPRYIGRK